MNLNWYWFDSHEYENFQKSKTELIKACLSFVEKDHFPFFLYKKEIFLIVWPELKKIEKSLLFRFSDKWKLLFENYIQDVPLIIELLVFFSEELLDKNWNEDWTDFVHGTRNPYKKHLDYIYYFIKLYNATFLYERLKKNKAINKKSTSTYYSISQRNNS